MGYYKLLQDQTVCVCVSLSLAVSLYIYIYILLCIYILLGPAVEGLTYERETLSLPELIKPPGHHCCPPVVSLSLSLSLNVFLTVYISHHHIHVCLNIIVCISLIMAHIHSRCLQVWSLWTGSPLHLPPPPLPLPPILSQIIILRPLPPPLLVTASLLRVLTSSACWFPGSQGTPPPITSKSSPRPSLTVRDRRNGRRLKWLCLTPAEEAGMF